MDKADDINLIPGLQEVVRQKESLVRWLIKKGSIAQATEIAGQVAGQRELLKIVLAENSHHKPISRHAELCINAQGCAK